MSERWRDWVVPDEWQTAGAVLSEVVRSASRTSHFWLKQAVGFGLPFAVGSALCYLALNSGGVLLTASPHVARLASAVIAFAAIVSGFMITLMLFTGKVDGHNDVAAERVHEFKAKVCYLLLVQGLSVLAHVLTALSAVTWLILHTVGTDEPHLRYVMMVMCGMAMISVTRTILVPLQIFELHAFTLDAMVRTKIEASKARSAADTQAALAALEARSRQDR